MSETINYVKDVVQVGFSVWVAIYLIVHFRSVLDRLGENIQENTKTIQELKIYIIKNNEK